MTENTHTLQVTEVFKSCQGEGPDTGLPTVFVRFAGCNLACAGTPCSWCDTPRAQLDLGTSCEVKYLVSEVTEYAEGCNRVCITGGEPLFQDPVMVRDFVSALKKQGYFIEVFTNGSIIPSRKLFEKVDRWVIDFKCPSSSVHTTGRIEDWVRIARPQDVVKFVVADERDVGYAQIALSVHKPLAMVSFSPCIIGSDTGLDPVNIWWMQKLWRFCVEGNYHFGLQVHKVVFGNQEGV